MAGGVGSRFWPASRETRPKQFLDIVGNGESLIQTTFNRFTKITSPEQILIITNEAYKGLVAQHLPLLPSENILCEPSRNNTAPSIAYTAMHVHARNPNATLIVAPSDHIIEKETAFLTAIQIATNYAQMGEKLITLGISPTRPDTGYGYIQYEKEEVSAGVHKVLDFKEKPNLETAEKYLKEGGYVWNAGIFIWNTSTILNELKLHAPQIHNLLCTNTDIYNTPEEQSFIKENYPKTEKISIDYAIMEKSQKVFTIPCDIGWSDLGTWASLHAFSPKDNDHNVVQGENTIIADAKGNIIRSSDKKLVIVRGLENFMVIDEDDVLLIFPKNQEQDVKQLKNSLEDKTFS